MTTIEFQCERCEAALKVRKMLAGRTIQCPKCGRKTAVPKPDSATDPAEASTVMEPGKAPEPAPVAPAPPPAQPTPPAAPAPEPSADAEPPAKAAECPAPEASPPEPVGAQTPPAEQIPSPEPPAPVQPSPEPPRQKLAIPPVVPPASLPPEPPAAPVAQPKATPDPQRMRETEKRAQEAEQAAQRAAQEVESLRAALAQAQHSASDRKEGVTELEAARKRILELESRQELLQKQLRETRDALASGSSLPPSAVSFEDQAEADALLADLRSISFAKTFRGAVLIHVVVLLLTSVGYFWRVWQSRTTEAPAVEAPASQPGTVADSPVRDPAPVQEAPPRRTADPVPEPERPLSDIERRIQELPAPGEVPDGPSLELNL